MLEAHGPGICETTVARMTQKWLDDHFTAPEAERGLLADLLHVVFAAKARVACRCLALSHGWPLDAGHATFEHWSTIFFHILFKRPPDSIAKSCSELSIG